MNSWVIEIAPDDEFVALGTALLYYIVDQLNSVVITVSDNRITSNLTNHDVDYPLEALPDLMYAARMEALRRRGGPYE